jgi:signal transduction histidine kinase
MYNSKSFTHFTETVGLGINLVNSILEDSHGNLWFGTDGGGLCRYDGESFTSFTLKGDIRSNIVSSILEDSHGNLWFSSKFNGVIMYNGESFTHFIGLGDLTCNIKSILEDSHGNLWFGKECYGVSMYNGETFTNFAENEGLSQGNVLSILEDSHGNLWFGTHGGGVSRYDGETFTHFTEKEGLSNNIVNSILEDSFGNLWFGTAGGGVSVFDGKSFSILTEKEDLSSNFVTSILEDDNQNIWLGTERGLNLLVFNSESVAKTNNNLFTSDARDSLISIHYQAIHSFSNQDGLKGMNFFRNSALLDSKNRIWWGSGKSLTMLDMNNFKIPNEPPSIQLNQIDIAEKFVNYRNLKDSTKEGITFDSVARFSNYPLNLALSYELNHLTFHFSAMECYDPHKIKYSYIMEGFSNDWSIPTTEAKAEYRNLPHGNHTFKVKAIGEAQIWSEPFEYTFTILPPWWHTWWARVLYGIAAVSLIIGIVRQRTSALNKRQKELEHTVEERTAELVSAFERLRETQSQLVQSTKMAALGELTAGIAHEINNPVSFTRNSSFALDQDLKDITKLIQKYRSYFQKLKQDKSEIEEFEKGIDYQALLRSINQEISGIKEGTRRTTEIVKNLREFSHEDSGEKELADIHQGIDAALNILKSRFTTKISLTKNYDQSNGEIKCHIGQLNQVFLNVLSNALDAIEEKGEIVITTKNQENSLLVSIKNDGKGIPEEIINKIFDPFFTTKKIGDGTGLGLSISHGIIKNHGGTISVVSNQKDGTRFDIILPYIK